MKKTWGVISETLNRKVKNCSNKEIIVEEFNKFFATVGEKIEQNIRKHEGSHYRNYLTNDIRCNFAFHLIDNNATMRIIKILKFQLVKAMMEFPQSS